MMFEYYTPKETVETRVAFIGTAGSSRVDFQGISWIFLCTIKKYNETSKSNPTFIFYQINNSFFSKGNINYLEYQVACQLWNEKIQ